jgi:indole-3-glycerol phosphate synthase
VSHLESLLQSTRARVAAAKQKSSEGTLEQRIAGAREVRPFSAALSAKPISFIAEIKRASPSAGDLNANLNAAAAADAYARGGAAALSVLTEPHAFRGTLEDLEAASGAGLPVLRKDFIVDPFQLFESRAAGADAVLLIARVLGTGLGELMAGAAALGMDALVEVYDDADLEIAEQAGASLLGVNHRDLDTFEVDPDRTRKLAARIPEGVTLVALSGVKSRAEVSMLEAAGADAILVGESLVTSQDPVGKLRELRGVER